jgi:molybdate transport system substrate-binding protein
MRLFFNHKILSIILILISAQNTFAKTTISETNNKVGNITIFSESNMMYSLVRISRLYSKTHNSIASVIFNNPSELIQNIDNGEPVDIFIASHSDWSDILKQKGLIDVYNITNVAQDKLVLITSTKNKKIDTLNINQSSELSEIINNISQIKLPLIIDSPNTSLGKYTQSALAGIDISRYKIYPRAVNDKKSVISFVHDNNEYCAIVLLSAIKNYDNIVVLKTIDNINIYYQAFVIAGNNMEKARNFSNFLDSEPVQNIFIENGFIVQ